MGNINIAGRDFESKKSALEHISKVLRANGSRIYKPPGQGFDFLYQLLQRHPEREEKLSHGLAYFEVVMKNQARTNYTVYIVNWSGQKLDFSWRVCVTGNKKDRLAAAMRLAIKDQIDFFRDKQSHIKNCELCKVELKESETHIDHITKFRNLRKQFLESYPKQPPTEFDDCPHTHDAKFKPQDQEFENAWYLFHELYAELRVLCKKCNLQIH